MYANLSRVIRVYHAMPQVCDVHARPIVFIAL